MILSSSTLSILLLTVTSSCSAATSLQGPKTSAVLSLPTIIPQNASAPVSPTYVGFAFEERSFYLYAGNESSPNNFSRNLIHEIFQRTGANPVIRVGGTSLDHSSYDPNQKESVTYPPGQSEMGIPMNITIGPSFFSSFQVYPFAKYILDIPFAKLNLTNSLAYAKAGYQSIGSDKLVALEIGNEPNLYPGTDRPADYGPAAYAKQWGIWTDLVNANMQIADDTKIYETATIASAKNLGNWAIPTLFGDGLKNFTDRIKSVSMHFYQTSASPSSDLQRDLMDHNAIATRMSTQFGTAVKYLKNNLTTPIPLNLAEVGSSLNPSKYGENLTLESNLGATLWQVDMLLYGMSIGVNRVNYQSGIGFGYAMWQPIYYNNRSAHVAPPYYAHVFAADFIGKPASQDKSIRVANVDMDNDRLSAYAAYDPTSKALTKIAIVNLELWNATTPADADQAPSVNVDIIGLPAPAKQVKVKKLTSPVGAYATGEEDGVTFAGEQWTYANDGIGKVVLNDTETLDVGAQENVTVSVRASSAVIVEVMS